MKPILLDEIAHALRGEMKSPGQKGLIQGVKIDSRIVQQGDLFVAIRGPQHDGHDYIDQAVEKGAKAVVVDRNIPPSKAVLDKGVMVLRVSDSVEALGRLAKFYRGLCSGVHIIAITGSTGKTTVREMIYHVLSQTKKGHRSPKNYNNQIGVPLTLLGIASDDEFAVVEMGCNVPGEITSLSQIAQPDIAVITNVGASHLEGLKTIDQVSVEKVSIVAGLKKNGLVICGVDHTPTLERVRALGRHVITFGLEKSCDVYATDMERQGNKLCFTTNDHCRVELSLAGMHHIKNALAALAVCRRLGVDSRQFAHAMKNFSPVPGRMNVQEVSGITVIDDSYNANPLSMKAALNELACWTQAKRRVAICGDMAELGAESENYHTQLGRRIATAQIELFFAVGHMMAHAAEAALLAGMKRGHIIRCVDSRRMARLVKSMLFDGDVVLVKGSHCMEMEKVITSLNRWKGRD